ncbi:Pre-mRNA-splicing factor syf2 [Echinococcus granulosus]|uniref:Pre-mRNA-splicing factor SYF2 n=1 Tax=Echinococcus granulosus TaxID=6210 RepID=U6J999_ECHGR|nr:Pre-mRNA-splicing factor syf2 [Echinococcus granulosus]EUB57594.1 Pre-mRNA-splicing factor syf2 [Echinococcus granulosus]KAH9277704.1 Pre-mRNA-splicing factor syf2 [Echinococcus granulosus]CDS20622.1 pre mRNA splicing factor syf2 [Echinococcus granulosus]
MSVASDGKREDRLSRLRQLQLKIDEAKKANHVQVVEEDRRKHLPSNWEAKQARMRWEEEDDAFRAECAKKGVDVDRAKNLNISAELVNRLEMRKRRRRPHLSAEDEAGDVTGFASYADASHKKYLRQTKALKPDLVAYQKQKERLGDLVYPTAHTIGLVEAIQAGAESSREAVERMAATLKEQEKKKAAYSRRRAFDPDADIDYINERNKRYNELLDRHYGKYTAEIKQNLERGTAL